MKIDAGGKTGRRPGAVSSREALLVAAREQFTQHGFKGATVRAIAAQAGADPTLIRHFFGGKDGLFAAAMELPADTTQLLRQVFEGSPETLGHRLTNTYLSIWENPETAAPLRAIFVSAFTNDQALSELRTFLVSTILEPASQRLPQDDPGLRLTLAMSHLIGIAITRHLLAAPPMVSLTLEHLVELVGPSIQQYLTGSISLSHAAVQ